MHLNDFEMEMQIDNYLNGTMTAEEEAAFKITLDKFPNLREQVELNRLIQIYQEHPEIPNVRHLIKSIMKDKRPKKSYPIPKEIIVRNLSTQKTAFTIQFILPIVALAAAVLVIIFLPYFRSSKDVFTNNFNPVPVMTIDFEEEALQLVSATKQKDLKEQVKAVRKALGKQQYDTALHLLNVLFEAQWLKDELFIYRANALLGKGNIDEAIAEYEQLLENDTELKAITIWYLALAHVKNEDTEKAKILLQELSTTDNNYQRKAKRLLKRM